MKYLKTLFFIFIVLIICLCYIIIKNDDHARDNTNIAVANNLSTVRALSQNAPNNSFGIATYRDFNTSIPLYPTQYINSDQFNGYLEVMNNYNRSNQFLIMALLDYQLIPFNYNSSIGMTHFINVSPNKGYIYPFNITGITSGYHDLTFLSIENPYDRYINLTVADPRDNNSSTVKVWYRFPLISSTRFNIINENDKKPSLISGNIEGQNITSGNSEGLIDGIFITKERLSTNVSNNIWMYENASQNETVDYYINVANARQENMSYAIIQMLDNKQIPINNNSSDNVYYGYLNRGEVCSIPAAINAPDINGEHELLILLTIDPYNNIELEPGKLNPAVDGIIDAVRVGINVG